ncbi:hypothetical protein [Streptococcus anginosus]|uniref:hypothetical protein n=1 Tax=Streptococcus anginosus TaxID=1328 RepID=UPI0034A1A221
MTSKEWVENFESLNGRKPTPEEYSEAMKSGEFFQNVQTSETTFEKISNKFQFLLFRMMHDRSVPSYTEFKVKKTGGWLNIFIVLTDFIFLFAVASLFQQYAYNSIFVSIPFVVALMLLSVLNMLPTLISYTNWKYLIFVLNIFLGPTIIGWLILLIVAIFTNNSAKRDQEMAYLLRKMTDKLGEDK